MADKTEYERAVQDFESADAAYMALQDHIESGEFLKELLDRSVGNHATAMQHWNSIWDKLRQLKEDRSAKLKSAKDALRQAVVLGPTQERGPDGSSTVVKCGDFTVTSVTSRSFDPQSLFNLCQKFGVMDELMALKFYDKSGVETPYVKQEWSIAYTQILEWLRSKGLQKVIDGAYDEKEKTPAVKGPKDIAFLGEKKGD